MARLTLKACKPDQKVEYENEVGVLMICRAEALVESNLIKLFNRSDREQIRRTSRLYHISYGDSILWFGALLALYSAVILCAIFFSFKYGKNFHIFGTTQSLGTMIFAFSFVCLDSLSETLGYKYARAAVLINCAMLALLAVAVWFSCHF